MARIPSKSEIRDWISQNPTQSSKRDIAKAFGIKGADRIDLKRLLKELEDEGVLRKSRKSYRDPEKLPPVSVLQVLALDTDGDLLARPMEWGGDGPEPRILLMPRASDPALGEGDRVLARLTEERGADHAYSARLIRRIGTNPLRILGVYKARSEGGRIQPVEKGSDKEWLVPEGLSGGARDGELVEAEQAGPKTRMGLPKARVISRLGDPSAPRAVSLIAIHHHGIPDRFPDDVIAEADRMTPAGRQGREDLRALPLITIDPSDARDHDDACCAIPDEDPGNAGGHLLWVAIADVAHYVRPGSALDREARKRGNSTYFPDRVVPMLPDRLSGDLCSLHEGVPRACIAVEMKLNAEGRKLSHRFVRGLMKSPASLSYVQVQAGMDGEPDEKVVHLLEEVIRPLFACYDSLVKARAERQPLELDLPERQIVLDEAGKVTELAFKDRLDAHRMIEEFMVLANVAAAETLIAKRQPLLFRVHEEPSPEKLDTLREVAGASGLTLAKGQVLKTAHLNRLLEQAAETETNELINMATLRSMTQAYYNPENFGHFGLALKAYAHFTSPIRRYSDLIVHRALVSAHGWGEDGLSPGDIEELDSTAEHISNTERRSMMAERDTTDRYLAAYLNDRVGSEFTGRISGIARFGVFVKLDETGADAMIPMRNLGAEYFHHDADSQTLMGADTGQVIGMGQRAVVKLNEAAPDTGGLIVELVSLEGKTVRHGPKSARGQPPRRKKAQARRKSDKTARKVKRTRQTRS
ncbi:MAG: ribonuclease R [Salibaculum sp.]|uniref:ribonuclease R n=1 Tax=Salibaculum sp. TaxID=2855480 RepID=UPI002870828F|nr:ribonuclease R [Salibaculum sp.]MDR9482651.1 ribonuclease R [Salibaculum sp.]